MKINGKTIHSGSGRQSRGRKGSSFQWHCAEVPAQFASEYLVYWPVLLGQWLQGDIAKCHFVLFEVLAEHVPQGFGLLRAEVDALLIVNGHLFRRLLLRRTEGEEKVPYADANLHAIGVGFAWCRQNRVFGP